MREISTTDSKWGTGAATSKPWLLVSVALLVAVGLTGAATGALASSTADSEHDQLVVTEHCEDEVNYLTIENPNDEAAAVDLTWEPDDPSLSLRSDGQISTQVQTSTQATASADGTQQTTVQTLTATIPGDETTIIAGLEDDTYDLSATIDGADVDVYHDEKTDEHTEKTDDPDDHKKTDDHTEKTDDDHDTETDADHTEVTLECGTADDTTHPIFLTVLEDEDANHVDTDHTDGTQATTSVETSQSVAGVHLDGDETDEKDEKEQPAKKHETDNGDEYDDTEHRDETDKHDAKNDKVENGEHADTDQKDEKME